MFSVLVIRLRSLRLLRVSGIGRNDLGLPLYDFSTGGCGDGLHIDRVNENQGAESTLAFHLALAEMNSAEHWITPPPLPAP